MPVRPAGVFHGFESPDDGSASIDSAVRDEGIHMRTNFNIHDLNLETGRFKVIRKAFKGQP